MDHGGDQEKNEKKAYFPAPSMSDDQVFPIMLVYANKRHGLSYCQNGDDYVFE